MTIRRYNLKEILELNFIKITIFLVSLTIGFHSFGAKDEIIIIKNNWTSQIVLSHILQELYTKAEINSQLKSSTVESQWGKLARGWSHIQVEAWQGTMEKMVTRVIESKSVSDLGDHNVKTREDWWYPLYVKKLCPGLPDWKALKKCSHLFKTKDSAGKGVYIGGPWEKPDSARVRSLELNFEIQRVKEGDELWKKLKVAVKSRTPILLFNWTPNWVEAKFPGEFVNFPDFHPDCETDPKWGINKKHKYDCGNPKSGWLKKLAWSGLRKKSSCAYKILNNMVFTNKMISNVASLVDSDGLTHQKAAQTWINKNKEVWQRWIPKECQR